MKQKVKFENGRGTKNQGPLVLWVGLVWLFYLSPSVFAYSGGTGTLQLPYVIATPEDLIQLGQTPEDYNKHFKLANDIDLKDYEFSQALIAPYRIVSRYISFEGSIDGDGHVIYHLTIQGSNNLGLIGTLGVNGRVWGLGISDANIVATGSSIGLLAGENEGTIVNSYSSGSVWGSHVVGGLIGKNYGKIVNSFSSGQVHGYSAGGLAGISLSRGRIINCYTVCLVDREDTLDYGGLVGTFVDPDTIEHSFWDIQTTGISTGDRGIGLSTEQMMDVNSFVTAGWNFLGIPDNGCTGTWMMPPGGGYPVLSVFNGIEPTLPWCQGMPFGSCTLSMDPNQVIWDANSIVLTDWESVAVTQTHRNPDNPAASGPQVPETIITISTQFDILENNQFIALNSKNHPVCRALDELGNEVQSANPPSPFMSTNDFRPLNVGSTSLALELMLDPNQPLPNHFSELDFLVYALTGQPTIVWDIPFETTEHELDVTPDLRMTVNADGNLDSDICSLVITLTPPTSGNETYDSGDNGTCPGENSIFSDFPDYDIAYHVKAIDTSGHISEDTLTGLVFHEKQTGRTWFSSSSLTVYNCRNIESLHITIAVNPHWVVFPLCLEGVSIAN